MNQPFSFSFLNWILSLVGIGGFLTLTLSDTGGDTVAIVLSVVLAISIFILPAMCAMCVNSVLGNATISAMIFNGALCIVWVGSVWVFVNRDDLIPDVYEEPVNETASVQAGNLDSSSQESYVVEEQVELVSLPIDIEEVAEDVLPEFEHVVEQVTEENSDPIDQFLTPEVITLLSAQKLENLKTLVRAIDEEHQQRTVQGIVSINENMIGSIDNAKKEAVRIIRYMIKQRIWNPNYNNAKDLKTAQFNAREVQIELKRYLRNIQQFDRVVSGYVSQEGFSGGFASSLYMIFDIKEMQEIALITDTLQSVDNFIDHADRYYTYTASHWAKDSDAVVGNTIYYRRGSELERARELHGIMDRERKKAYEAYKYLKEYFGI